MKKKKKKDNRHTQSGQRGQEVINKQKLMYRKQKRIFLIPEVSCVGGIQREYTSVTEMVQHINTRIRERTKTRTNRQEWICRVRRLWRSGQCTKMEIPRTPTKTDFLQ